MMSCAASPRTFYLKNDQKLDEVNFSQNFADSVKTYGAFYNKYFTSVEGAVANRPNTTYTFHRQLVITEKSGYDYARIYIPKSEYIARVKIAIKYPGSSKILRLNVKDLKEVIDAKENEFIDESNHYIYAVPDLKEGVIIDYSYDLNYDFIVPYEEIYLSSDLPVRNFKFQLILPNIYEHKLSYYNNIAEADVDKEYFKTRTKYEWDLRHVFPIKREAYSISYASLAPKLIYVINSYTFNNTDVDLINSWNDVAELYFFNIANDFETDSSHKKIFTDSILVKNREDSITHILDHVRDNFQLRSNASNKFNEATNVIKEGYGTEIGITSLVYIYLNKLGLKPEIILAKSYERGPIDFDNPNPYEIDNIFLRVDDVIFNAYSKAYPHGIIASEYQDTEAFIIKNPRVNGFSYNYYSYYYIRFPEFIFDIYKTRIDPISWQQSGLTNKINIDMNQNFKTNMSIDFFGNNSFTMIEALDLYTKEKDKDYDEEVEIQNYVSALFDDTKLKTYTLKIGNKLNQDLKMEMEIENSNLYQKSNDEYIVNLGQFIPKKYLDLLSEEERINDYDFSFEQLDQIYVSLVLPEGYKAELPENNFAKINVTDIYQNFVLSQDKNVVSLIYEGGVKKRIISHSKKAILDEYIKQLTEIRSIQVLVTKSN